MAFQRRARSPDHCGLGSTRSSQGLGDHRDIKDTIRVWAESHPEREWIVGRGWYYQAFNGAMPTRQLLDTLVPDRPAYLIAYDGHTGWANSQALKLAGITRRTKAPVNGIIVKDPRTGEPTGALKEAAMALMSAVAPKPTVEDRLAAIRAAIDEAHRLGITSVQDAGGTAADLDLFDQLARGRAYAARLLGARPTQRDHPALDELERLHARFAADSGSRPRREIDRRWRDRSPPRRCLEPYATAPARATHASRPSS